jgi:hypothetical protein
MIIEKLMAEHNKKATEYTSGEIFLATTSGQKLPLGVFARSRR